VSLIHIQNDACIAFPAEANSICDHWSDQTVGGRTVDNTRMMTRWSQILADNRIFAYPTCIRCPVGVTPSEFRKDVWHFGASWLFWLLRLINTLTYLLIYLLIELAWLGYRVVKILWQYVKPFRYNAETWRMDRQDCYINIARQCANARQKLYLLLSRKLWPPSRTTQSNTDVDVDPKRIRAQTTVSMPVLDIQIRLLFAKAIKL